MKFAVLVVTLAALGWALSPAAIAQSQEPDSSARAEQDPDADRSSRATQRPDADRPAADRSRGDRDLPSSGRDPADRSRDAARRRSGDEARQGRPPRDRQREERGGDLRDDDDDRRDDDRQPGGDDDRRPDDDGRRERERDRDDDDRWFDPDWWYENPSRPGRGPRDRDWDRDWDRDRDDDEWFDPDWWYENPDRDRDRWRWDRHRPDYRRWYPGVRDHWRSGVLGVGVSRAPGRGVIVRLVVADSAADEAGLRPGDRILGVDRERVDERRDLAQILSRHAPGDRVRIYLSRNGRFWRTVAELDHRSELY